MRPRPSTIRGGQGKETARLGNVIRRLVLDRVVGAFWRLLGYEDGDGNRETVDVELFQQVGFASRPKSGARVEAIVGQIGAGSNNPVVLATRDQDQVDDLALAADESCVHNTVARLIVKADGTIEARTHAGTAVALVKKSEYDALKSWLEGHMHAHGDPTTGTPTTTPPSATGTTKLKGE